MPDRERKTVTFPTWPIWNFQFQELDLMQILSVKFYDAAGLLQELPNEAYRLAIGRNGVSSLVLEKHLLPQPLEERPDAVIIEYEP